MGNIISVSEYIEGSINFRATIPRNKAKLYLSEKSFPEQFSIPTMGAFSTRRNRFLKLNSYDKITNHDGLRFKASHKRAIRAVRWANYLSSNGIHGIFAFNTNDGQGWEYETLDPIWDQVPVWQFARKVGEQRNVFLMPLERSFMGPRSENQPRVGFDPVPFKEKQPLIFWRGAPNGTEIEGNNIRWLSGEMESFTKTSPGSMAEQTALAVLRSFLRIRIVENLATSPIADVGFVIRPGMDPSPSIKKWYRPPTPRQKQCESRYLLALEGNDYPTSLYWSLASNCLVMIPARRWETALDFGLQAGVHYIPVGESQKEVEAAIEHCESNHAMCEEIIANAHSFIEYLSDIEIRDTIDAEVAQRYASAFQAIGSLDELSLSKY
ncbi:glycosyl transferase family 90 [Paracoccus sp. TOH]|uniref:glycosyl transferase family 90 n=1 Tax=Paracoccus sp. TOH TaxID=1263728 RepID=UPI0025B22DE5|nr:glycosyl transferase family 90 [Paracoccus sp. TOH]WJS86331.1 glycosyl transferase family 90 [Paracoccus sp. TOH]